MIHPIISINCYTIRQGEITVKCDESKFILACNLLEYCRQSRNMWQYVGQNVPDNGLQGVTRADFDLTKRDRAFIKTEYLCINVTPGGVLSLPGVVYQFALFVVQEAPDLLK